MASIVNDQGKLPCANGVWKLILIFFFSWPYTYSYLILILILMLILILILILNTILPQNTKARQKITGSCNERERVCVSRLKCTFKIDLYIQ